MTINGCAQCDVCIVLKGATPYQYYWPDNDNKSGDSRIQRRYNCKVEHGGVLLNFGKWEGGGGEGGGGGGGGEGGGGEGEGEGGGRGLLCRTYDQAQGLQTSQEIYAYV